ncbi:MAG: protoglobin domain-containing protein [Myxococcota bacterium]
MKPSTTRSDNPKGKAQFDELAMVVGFGEADAERLRAHRESLDASLPSVVNRFYDVLMANTSMRTIFRDDAQIARQKRSLTRWLREMLAGPYDDLYVARHAEVGRVHERIGLEPHYMVSMMSVLRTSMIESAAETKDAALSEAVERILDVELAIMLGSFTLHDRDQRKAEERLLTLGQLAGSIGHELRNPLAVIDSSVALLRRYDLDDRTRKHVERIGAQAQACSSVLDGLLDLAREMPLDREDCSLLRVAHEAAGERDAIRIAGDDITVKAHTHMLKRLLVNLLDNALQNGADDVLVTIKDAGDEAHVFVDDNGPGIPKAILATLFEPLVTMRKGGIGLGLSLVRRVAKEHDGSIEAQNRPSGGARFVLRLPQPNV